MSDRKQQIIQEMIEMQKKFQAHEHSGEFNSEDYYVGSEWKAYRERYQELANEVREIACTEANFWK
ncbi:MAG TPA: hypothetical protein PLB10_04685 [Thiolinea sp.]|nr:hypothetical protein [Thiolinea sp.]